jgi:glycosyltransferase involved in cell wall biosynthesis
MNLSDVVVIIPAYINNDEQLQWFDECLKSVAQQGCKVSIHDDGSKIALGNVISTYYKRSVMFSRSDTNTGVSHARNEAIKNTPDKSLIFPLDCDDTLKEGTISKLLKVWKGTPVYPDVAKFGEENIEHYVLLDWDCSHLYNFVGYTSVNVLHSKEQWKAIGGYNETLDFYEDGEYNARLFGTYCAKRFPEPLVNYRIHQGQRTKQFSAVSRRYANKILEYVRRLDMPCPSCGGKKRSVGVSGSAVKATVNSSVQITGNRGDNIMVDNANLPLQFEGKVLARYIGGKGKGKHYYQGVNSKTYYRNVQHGELVYADPRDVAGQNEPSPSKLILIVRASAPAPKPVTASVPAAPVAEVVRTPKLEVEKTPVFSEPAPLLEKAIIEEEIAEAEIEFDDISKMSLKDLKGVDITCEDAEELLVIEEQGSNRPAVVKYLKSLCL